MEVWTGVFLWKRRARVERVAGVALYLWSRGARAEELQTTSRVSSVMGRSNGPGLELRNLCSKRIQVVFGKNGFG